MSHLCETLAARQPFGAAAMRVITLIVLSILSGPMASWAAMDFDEKYERDYNIFTPTNRYASDNPLNPANTYDPDNAFNPVNRYDPGNQVNPINKYNPNNLFNSVNQYHPDIPLNPANQYNSNVPFASFDKKARRGNSYADR